MATLVKSRVVTSFKTLSETTSLADAHRQLHKGTWGVLLDSSGTPLTLVLVEDLGPSEASTLRDVLSDLPASVIVGAEVSMQKLVDSLSQRFADASVRGAIVIDDQGVAGVLSAEEVDAFRKSQEYEIPVPGLGSSGSSGDSGLGGKRQSPLMRVACGTCNFINTGFFPDRRKPPPCQNPQPPVHELRFGK